MKQVEKSKKFIKNKIGQGLLAKIKNGMQFSKIKDSKIQNTKILENIQEEDKAPSAAKLEAKVDFSDSFNQIISNFEHKSNLSFSSSEENIN